MAARKAARKRMPAKTAGAKRTSSTAARGERADRGGAAESYFARQTPEQRALLVKLRALIVKGVPDATVTIKWGVPFYARKGRNVCALAAFKEHVGINFFAPPDVLVDPDKRLEGAGKGNRMLKVRSADDIDSAAVLRWLKAAAAANS